MRIGIAAMENSLDADVSSRFGRCPWFLVVDSESLRFEGFKNPAAGMPGGAGPAAAQELTKRGAEVAIAGEFGPKAESTLAAAGVRCVRASGPVRDAIANAGR